MAQIKKTGEQVEVIRKYEVSGAEPIKCRFRKSQIIPDRASARFINGEFVGLNISGQTLRKDGSPGENRMTEGYGWLDADDPPEWAVPLTRFEEDDLPESLAQRMENDASSYDNDPEPWGED